MKRVLLSLALVFSLAPFADAAWPHAHRGGAFGYGGYGSVYSAPMHVYCWPNGAIGFDSPTITYGATPATVYSPWLYSPYSYGYGGYGGGPYGFAGGGVW